MAIKLLTKQIRERLPRIGETEDSKDPIIQAKFSRRGQAVRGTRSSLMVKIASSDWSTASSWSTGTSA